ncbi:MAG: COX15/CtaA family protein, partial [Alphaproteobacteria bacterium]
VRPYLLCENRDAAYWRNGLRGETPGRKFTLQDPRAGRARILARASEVDGFVVAPHHRDVGRWLLVCAAMIFVMVVLGGITRLTGSGLSMVEWRPVLGVLPPMGDAEWRRLFELYRLSPEFREVNAAMGLGDFKTIFWWEYAHRLWGRLIGIAFLLPFLWFFVRGRVGRELAPRLLVLFVLGGLQGLLGWYMVRSGLVDVPEVSQYRLTAHLALALLIYGAMLWISLGLIGPERRLVPDRRLPGLRVLSVAMVATVGLTILSGGFMAGTDAGFAYNTFPLLDGRLVPAGYFDAQPWFLNPFENVIAIQFNHRTLAIVTLCLALATWWRSRWVVLSPRARRVGNGLAAAALAQVGLGITTLLLVMPVPLAVLHQATAMVLLSLSLWFAFELSHLPARARA